MRAGRRVLVPLRIGDEMSEVRTARTYNQNHIPRERTLAGDG